MLILQLSQSDGDLLVFVLLAPTFVTPYCVSRMFLGCGCWWVWPQCIGFSLLCNIPVYKAAAGYASILGSANILLFYLFPVLGYYKQVYHKHSGTRHRMGNVCVTGVQELFNQSGHSLMG